MTQARDLLRSFAGGEITPELYGRLDLTKYQTGLAECSNAIVLPHGPASRRTGFRFINECKDSTRKVRLLPFQFSAAQTAVLEFGHHYVRFIIDGATLLEANQTVTSIAGSTVNVTAHGYSAGDWVYIGSRFLKVNTTLVNSFTVVDLWGAAATPAGATVARVYTVATPYDEADLFALRIAQDADVLTITHPSYEAKELRRVGVTNWTLTAVDFSPPVAPVVPAVTPVVATAGTVDAQGYATTYIIADGVTESLASSIVYVNNILSLAGNYNEITPAATAGAIRYNIYKLRAGVLAYLGSTVPGGPPVRDNNIIPDSDKTPPENAFTLNGSVNNYPSAVTYHEQRRWFAGTNLEPQTMWATRSGTSSNLTSSLSVQDDDAMKFSIRARQQNAIRHLLPLSDLIALTVGGEFRIFADNSPAITPAALSVKSQGYTGSSEVQPALTSGSILYVQSLGARIRELAYDWQRQAFASEDVSIMAPHLFDGYTITDMAFVRVPLQSLWAVRSDGALLGMTYVPEQQVYAWHHHHTDGFFESVTVVSEGSEDALYAVVRRTVNGRSVRYIERLQTRVLVNQSDSFYVDSGLTYSGTPVTALSGLWHLEGETVQVLTDGAVHPLRTVTGGAITLEYAAAKASVGLAYTTDLRTLPLALEVDAAAGQGRAKNVNGLAIRVSQSALIKAGPDFSSLTEYPARAVTDPYGSPPALRTAELRFDITPDWSSDGSVCLRQDEPLPLTVLSLAVDVSLGG